MAQRLTFSQRFNIEPVAFDIQTTAMDEALRHSLWNVFHTQFITDHNVVYGFGNSDPLLLQVIRIVFRDHLKLPVDNAPQFVEDTAKFFKNYLLKQPWNKVYDILEFIVNLRSSECVGLIPHFNYVLERENSGYRFVDGILSEIIDDQSIASVEEAANKSPYESVAVHITHALALYSDRTNPDYRNSVKESISAVEAMAKAITGNPKATLGDALKTVQASHPLHDALKRGFSAIYGYTSDENGIRHALSGNETVSAAEAQFMLVACSAFINYLKLLTS